MVLSHSCMVDGNSMCSSLHAHALIICEISRVPFVYIQPYLLLCIVVHMYVSLRL